MSSELHVYQLQLDYLRSTKYDITASLRACVLARARVEANCVTGYVSLAKLDCLKSSKRESTPCRLYVSASDPASNNFFSSFYAIFCFPFSISSSPPSISFFSVHVSGEYSRENCIESFACERLVCSRETHLTNGFSPRSILMPFP